MTVIEDLILQELRLIPEEKHPDVLKVIQDLRHKYAPEFKRKSLLGLWVDQNIDLSKEEIDQLRREC